MKHKTNTHCSEKEHPDSRMKFIYAACAVFGAEPQFVKFIKNHNLCY